MNKKTLLLFLSMVALGFTVASYFLYKEATLNFVATFKQLAISKLQPVFNTWNSLPKAYQGIIIAGIPTLFTIFFAWTKSRAMKKLQQTQLEAGSQYKQLTGEIGEAKQQLGTLQSQKAELQEQVKAYADGNQAIKTLTGNLEEATNLVTQKQRQIDSLQKTIAELTGQITGLQKGIDIKVKKMLE